MDDNQENVSDESDELFSENYKVLKILMKMVNEAKTHSEKESPVELSEELEWDIRIVRETCKTEENVKLLATSEVIESLYGILVLSKSPELNELVLAVIADMCLFEQALAVVSDKKHLKNLIFYLLDVIHLPSLIETVRLLVICFMNEKYSFKWIEVLHDNMEGFMSHINFILQYSKNIELLSRVAYLLDELFKQDELFSATFIKHDMIDHFVEGVTTLTDDGEFESFTGLCRSLHLLQKVMSHPDVEESYPKKSILSQFHLFSIIVTRCSTSRVLYRNMKDSDGENMNSAEITIYCLFNISKSFIFNPPEFEDEDHIEKFNDFKENILSFAQTVVNAFGLLPAIEVYFPDGSPWSDICDRDDTLLNGIKEPPNSTSSLIYQVALELLEEKNKNEIKT